MRPQFRTTLRMACFSLILMILFLYKMRGPRFKQNGKGIVIRTEIHNDEYCIGYNFLEASEKFRDDGLEPVSLAIHGTSDMIKLLDYIPQSWDGPISLGLFIDLQSSLALEYLLDAHRCDIEFRRKMTVHFAFRISAFQSECPFVEILTKNLECEQFLKNRKHIRQQIVAPFLIYPSNLMRNIARIGAKSDIHFIADGDMKFSEGFAKKVKPVANRVVNGKNKKVLVVRRFESNKGERMPKNHLELEQSIRNKTVFEFHHKFFFEGHKIANLTQWFAISNSSKDVTTWEIPYLSCLWEVQPILHRDDLYNKDYFPARIKVMQSLVYSLCRANYTFHLLSHVFDVHEGVKLRDTVYSEAVIAHSKANFRKIAYDRFIRELNETYPDTLNKCGGFIM